MDVKLSRDELSTLIKAIDAAQEELCTGEGFDEANTFDEKLELLRHKFMELLEGEE